MNFNVAIKILSLSKEFYLDDLKGAYRKLARLNHPDLCPDKEEDMKKINQAYEYLFNGKYYKEINEYDMNKELIDRLCKELGELPIHLRYAYMIASDKGYKGTFIMWLNEQVKFQKYVKENLTEIKLLLNQLNINFESAKESFEEFVLQGYNDLFIDWLKLRIKEKDLIIRTGLVNARDLYNSAKDNGYTGSYMQWLDQQIFYKENNVSSDEIINRLYKRAIENGYNESINGFLSYIDVIDSKQKKVKK